MSEFYTNVVQSGKFLLVRGINNGKPFKERIPYKPYHYVHSQEPSKFHDINGKPVKRIDFDSIWDAKEFASKYDGVDNFDIFGFSKYAYNYMHDTYKDMKYDLDKVSVVYMDIECKSETGFPLPELANQEITAISLRKGNLRITLGTVDYVEHEKGIVYIKCRDETDLLYKFIDCWKKLDPDVISGWNVEFFDIPYLINRIIIVLGEDQAKQLSPWNQLRQYSVTNKWNKEQSSYKMIGITTIDLMVAYIKFSFKNHESFSLNYIASVEIGEKKIDYSEYDNLNDLYLKDPQKFIEYNIHDNDLVYKINEKTGLIEQIMTMAYSAKVNYEDAFGPVLFWEVIIKNHLIDRGIVVKTASKRNYKLHPIMGAYVKDPRPSKYKWVVGLDLDSLYPHLIMQYNISPETIAKRVNSLLSSMTVSDILDGKLREDQTISGLIERNNFGYTPNGCFFRNDVRGFLPELMDTMYVDRKKFKKLMIDVKKENEKAPSIELEKLITTYNNMQMALKISLNSAYGALTNEWFSWYDIDLGEAITYAGQLAIKWVANKLNKYLNEILKTTNVDYVIASDTDSAYLTMDKLVATVFKPGEDPKKIVAFLNKVCLEKINPLINEAYEELKVYTNAYENKMSMKVESISEAGIWTKKKRYALLMWWDEGVTYSTPAIKIKGLEAVQSSTPSICRDSIKKAVELILKDKKDELYSLVNEFEVKFKSSPFESIAATVAPSDIEKYHDEHTLFKKGAQAHVRGCLIYNKTIKEKGLSNTYQKINNGDKVKWAYMKTPNPIGQNAFAVYNKLPKELNLTPYIDYDKQFTNEFVGPVNKLAKLVGWDIENMNTLEAFFR